MPSARILSLSAAAAALTLGTVWFVWPRDPLPFAWSLKEIAKATPPYGYDGTEGVYILAWKIEDGNGSKVESCLVMRVLPEDDGHGQWHLSHLHRDRGEWGLSTMHVKGAKGTKYWPGMWIHHSMRFKTQPTNKDLYAACADQLEGVNWDFGPSSYTDWRIIDCAVCERNWQKVTGEKPTQFFQR